MRIKNYLIKKLGGYTEKEINEEEKLGEIKLKHFKIACENFICEVMLEGHKKILPPNIDLEKLSVERKDVVILSRQTRIGVLTLCSSSNLMIAPWVENTFIHEIRQSN